MTLASIKKTLGLEKMHPEIQYFLDSANLSIAIPGALLVMLVELLAFINTFFYTFKEGQDPAKWLLYHRSLYIFLFLAAAQLFAYAVYHKRTQKQFSRFKLDASILFFIVALLFFVKEVFRHDDLVKQIPHAVIYECSITFLQCIPEGIVKPEHFHVLYFAACAERLRNRLVEGVVVHVAHDENLHFRVVFLQGILDDLQLLAAQLPVIACRVP